MYLYVHVPFCASKCIYCDFTVVLQKHASKHGGVDAFEAALLAELDQRLAALPENITTINGIYVGGGTPSLLPARFYARLFNRIQQRMTFTTDAEITLEANPNAMVDEPAAYEQTGFNRVSIGIQCLQDAELKTLSRGHTAAQAIDAVRSFQAGGFKNISVDLMYGFPKQTLASWQDTLQQVGKLGVQHVSFYGLQVEDATPMARLVKTSAYPLPDEDVAADMMALAASELAAHGMERYEISNAAQCGYESRHNLNYWQNWNDNGGQYLAIGPGAHGFVNGGRYANSDDYATWLTEPVASAEQNAVTAKEQLENAFIFGLRTRDGVPLDRLRRQFGADNVDALVSAALVKFPQALMVEETSKILRLHQAYWGISNPILQAFIGE